MSAFICGNDHINAMVNYAVAKKVSFWNPKAETRVEITRANAEEIGRMLLDENVRSVGYRYNDRIDADEKNAAGSFKFKFSLTQQSPVQILKSCNCYDYQCCETDDWEQTLAHRIMQAIMGAAIRALPGYEQASWG